MISRNFILLTASTIILPVFLHESDFCNDFNAAKSSHGVIDSCNFSSNSEFVYNEHQPVLQQIFNQLDSINPREFSHAVEHPERCDQIQTSLKLLSQVTLSDLSLTDNMIRSLKYKVSMEVASSYYPTDDRGFRISVFLLPRDESLPIHNHPGMTVCSKVLAGSLGVQSFSLIAKESDVVLARMVRNETMGPASAPWLLSPSQGNLHGLRAREASAVLEILLPPYLRPRRPCRYFAVLATPPLSRPSQIAPIYGLDEHQQQQDEEEEGKEEEEGETVDGQGQADRRGSLVMLRRLTPSEEAAVVVPRRVPYQGMKPGKHNDLP